MNRYLEKRLRPTIKLASNQDRGAWIEHLASIYSLEHSILNIAISFAAAATPISLSFIYGLPRNCSTPAQGPHDYSCIKDPVFAVLPLAPLMTLLFFAYVFLNGRIIGKYARELERKLTSAEPFKRTEKRITVVAPALSRYSGALYGGERRGLYLPRALFLLLGFSLFGVAVTTMIFLIHQIQNVSLRATSYGTYATLLCIAVAAFIQGGSHRSWDQMGVAVSKRDALADAPFVRYQSWMTFLRQLIFPRLASIMKVVQVPGYIALVLALEGPSLIQVLTAHARKVLASLEPSATRLGIDVTGLPGPWIVTTYLLFGVFAFEYLLYQTRYFLNAVREDPVLSPQLPASSRNDEPLSFTAGQRIITPLLAFCRVMAFVWFCTHTLLFTLKSTILLAALFVIAFTLYEIPRGRGRRIAETRHYQVDAPGNLPSLGFATFLLVGAGYALRLFFYLNLFRVNPILDPWILLLLIAAYAQGCAMVSAGWVTELQGARALTPVRGGEETWHPAIASKPHLIWTASHLNLVATATKEFGTCEESHYSESAKVLMQRAYFAAKGWRPWSMASVLAAANIALAVAVKLQVGNATAVLIPTAFLALFILALAAWDYGTPITLRNKMTLSPTLSLVLLFLIPGWLAVQGILHRTSNSAAVVACATWLTGGILLKATLDPARSSLAELLFTDPIKKIIAAWQSASAKKAFDSISRAIFGVSLSEMWRRREENARSHWS